MNSRVPEVTEIPFTSRNVCILTFQVAICSLFADHSWSIRIRKCAEILDKNHGYISAGSGYVSSGKSWWCRPSVNQIQITTAPLGCDVINVLDQWTGILKRFKCSWCSFRNKATRVILAKTYTVQWRCVPDDRYRLSTFWHPPLHVLVSNWLVL